MLPSKKVILSSVLSSISFLAISSTAPANWRKLCCWCKDPTVDSLSAKKRASASVQPNVSEEERRELVPVPAAASTAVVSQKTTLALVQVSPQEQEQATAATAVSQTTLALVQVPLQEQEATQPLLASSSANSSSVSTNFFDLVALTSVSSLGLTLKSIPTLEVEEHRIQETEEGVRIVSTPTGGIIFVFPNTAYVAFQPHASRDEVPDSIKRMRRKKDSILATLPQDVRGLFVSCTRDALKKPNLTSFSERLNQMLLRAMGEQGIEVRTYAATDRSLKEVLITGPEEQLLQIITGTTNGPETISRAFLSKAFRALSHKAEEAGSSSEDE